MEKIQKSTPALRFRDGQGNSYPDWEERKLGQIFTVRYGKEHKKLSDGNVPVIGTGGVIRYANGVLYSEPSVLIGRKGTIDKPQFINQPFWAVDTVFFTEIGPSNVSYFVFLIVSKINWKRYNEASGLPSLSANTIKGIRVNIPSKEEQQKIANFLSSVDTKIEQLSEKKELLELYKKGMMQKLFSQEIRFRDEQGNDYPDWEGNTLGMLFEISAGGDIDNSHSRKRKDGIFRYPIYANSEKAKGLHGYSDSYRVKQKCITVSGRGTLGVAHARFEEFFPIVRLLVLIPRKESNLIFFEHAINLLQIFNESTGVPQLTTPQLKKYSLNYPSINEQQKIADFLSAIDIKIELVAEQLEQARTFKKGLLQQMFI